MRWKHSLFTHLCEKMYMIHDFGYTSERRSQQVKNQTFVAFKTQQLKSDSRVCPSPKSRIKDSGLNLLAPSFFALEQKQCIDNHTPRLTIQLPLKSPEVQCPAFGQLWSVRGSHRSVSQATSCHRSSLQAFQNDHNHHTWPAQFDQWNKGLKFEF